MTPAVLSTRWAAQPPPAPAPPPPPPSSPEAPSLGDAAFGAATEFVPDWMKDPVDAGRSAVGDYLQAGVIGVLESVWTSGLTMLRDTLALIDAMTRFDLVAIFASDRGLGQVWPALWWLAILVATGVFFSQIVAVVARGGWGASRLLLGPIHFGIALAFVLSLSAGLVAAADGIARGLLDLALGSPDFAAVLDPPPADPNAPADAPVTGVGAIFIDNPDLGEGLTEMSRAIIMAIAGALGAAASIGFAFEMVVRQAIIVMLIAVSPIAAAGLLSGATSSWWWRTARWLAAAILLEPALALLLVIGVGMLASASGVSGLLAGAVTLLAAVFCPWAAYKLLAFVDPATGAGMDLRAITARRPAPTGTARPGAAVAEDTHAARFAEQARTHARPVPPRAGGLAASARRAGRTVGGALTAGYHSVAAAGEYAGARLNQQGAQTGVGHPGGVSLRRTPGTRPAPAPNRPAPPPAGNSHGGDPPQVSAPVPAPAPERGGPAHRDSADSPARGPASRPGAVDGQDTSHDQQQRQQEQRSRGPRPAPAADRRPPKPPPTTPPPRPRPDSGSDR